MPEERSGLDRRFFRAGSSEKGRRTREFGRDEMFGTILLILLIVLLLGALPSWPYSRGWGYYPSGIFGVVLLVIIVLLLMGHL